MNQMLPGNKSTKEIEDKLWNHLFFIADYDLDVTVPEAVTIHRKDEIFTKPSKIDYPQKPIPYRHYGHNVHTLIAKAISMEDGPKKEEFCKIIASYMKLAYRTWGKEQFVNDELIKEDLKKMSKGALVVSDEANIDAYKNVTLPTNNNNQRRKHYKGQGGQGQHGRRFSGKGGQKNRKRRH